ncbi:PTS lactose transporter subunit IIC [Bacillus manliponensis]|uniref:Permease IIC component n=1 Tax=Bacillus manliponensis TaxID=574376 RepID=A0A073K224_9BACI|nr:PTS cellobiose transporter subunit IIC [Bacillus manliponensis]KEK21369.1 PTS lactose transporter subunit IIC [Bacillus manliponensis]
MQKFIAFMDKYVVPVAGKIGSQRHLVAVRDGFIAVMPLIIIGSLATLVNTLPIDVFQNFMKDLFGDTWKQIGGGMWTGSFAILALLVAIGVSYNLAKSYGIDALSAAIITFGSLIVISPTTPKEGGLDFAWTGAQGLFVSIITALVVTELFRFLLQKNITIKMPESVPPAVIKSFAALLPATIILFIVASIQLAVKLADTSIHQMVFETIQMPLQGLAATLPSAIIVALLVHVLWFFGLHGPNILGGIIDPIYLPALEKNIKQFGEGVSAFDVPYIFTKPFFDVFIYMGGSGATLAFLVAIFIVAKSSQLRAMNRVSFTPGLFNINEPVIFGTPIVLNPILFIPFVFTPVVLVITTYIAMATGLVPKTVALVPWNIPPIFSGYLATGGSIRGILLQLFNFTIAVAMYLPFVLMCDRTYVRAEKTANQTGNDSSVQM